MPTGPAGRRSAAACGPIGLGERRASSELHPLGEGRSRASCLFVGSTSFRPGRERASDAASEEELPDMLRIRRFAPGAAARGLAVGVPWDGPGLFREAPGPVIRGHPGPRLGGFAPPRPATLSAKRLRRLASGRHTSVPGSGASREPAGTLGVVRRPRPLVCRARTDPGEAHTRVTRAACISSAAPPPAHRRARHAARPQPSAPGRPGAAGADREPGPGAPAASRRSCAARRGPAPACESTPA